MSTIKIVRPKQAWRASPATLLPVAWLVRLFRRQWNYTVLLDHRPSGKIRVEQVKVFNADPGEHRLRMRFLFLRRSKELQITLKEGEERDFRCGTSGLGWPTLQEGD
jgi:hypothetical protein